MKLQSIQCKSCQQESNVNNSKFQPGKILFIEFASDAINTLSFLEEIFVCDVVYLLKAVVFCHSRHFTTAVFNGNTSYHIDDMCHKMRNYLTTIELFRQNKGPFFALYVLNTENETLTHYFSLAQVPYVGTDNLNYSPVSSSTTNDIKCNSNKTQNLKCNLDAQDGQTCLKRQKTNIDNTKSHTTKNVNDNNEQNIRIEIVKKY